MRGTVSLVGAGPWDPELLTLAGQERLSQADVVIADYLVNPALFAHCREDAEILQRERNSPAVEPLEKLDQATVNRIMVERAQAGKYVVRLKGGDPMIFGRGAEEATYLREHGIPYEFVPGVTAPIAAPEYAGIPVTHRDNTPSVSFVSGFEAYDKAGLTVAWKHLALSAGTLILMMSVKNCRANAQKLVEAGRAASTPAAIVRWGTRGIQRSIEGTLENIADRLEEAGLRAPSVMIVGEVVKHRSSLMWREQLPLFGKRILITRSPQQGGELLMKLNRKGADVVAYPCLDIRLLSPNPALENWLGNQKSSSESGLILSSPNAVKAFFLTLDRLAFDSRRLAKLRIAAIGPSTAKALAQRGIYADIQPKNAHSEGLVESLKEQNLLNQSWTHLRAKEGRSYLQQAIEAAGGRYQLIPAYEAHAAKPLPALARSLRPYNNTQDATQVGEGVDAILCTSGKAAQALQNSLQSVLGADMTQSIFSNAQLLALGPVTGHAMQELGMKVDAIASGTTPDEITKCIQSTVQPAE